MCAEAKCFWSVKGWEVAFKRTVYRVFKIFYGSVTGGILLHPLQDVILLSLFFNKGDFFMSKSKSVKTLVICGLLTALSIIFGKFLNIPIGETLRFSFENTPLFLAGFMFGPFIADIVAFAADILGSILRGYAINPLITLGAVFMGVSSGFLFKILKNTPLFLRVLITVGFSHILGSVLIKTFGLSLMYGTPYLALLPARIINYLIMIIIDVLVLYFILKNRSFKKLLESNL